MELNKRLYLIPNDIAQRVLRRVDMIGRFLKNQLGQITITELIIIIAIVVTIALTVVGVTGDTTKQIDSHYQAELKKYFVQGE